MFRKEQRGFLNSAALINIGCSLTMVVSARMKQKKKKK